MFNTNFATQLMKQSLSDEFLSQLVAGYLKIQKEQYSEASDHFNKMLYSEHNPNDDDILWIAKSHIYKKLGKREESKMCMKLVTDALENTEIYRNVGLKFV
jgi:tetratricopeptide (TPR) repeat protein